MIEVSKQSDYRGKFGVWDSDLTPKKDITSHYVAHEEINAGIHNILPRNWDCLKVKKISQSIDDFPLIL